MTLHLRPYQSTLIDGARAAFAAGRTAPLLVAPTGAGKTAVSGAIAQGVAARSRIAWFVVPSLVLLSQTAEKFREYGIPCGVLHEDYTPSPRAAVQVISIQTLDAWVRKGLARDPKTGRLYLPARGRRPSMWAPDLLVMDEAHHASAASYLRVVAALLESKLLGVTATPERQDGQGLGKDHGGVFDALIEGPTLADLIADGYLCQATVYAPPVGIDMSGVRTSMGDFATGETARRVDKPGITGSVVGHYRSLAMGRRAIAFCCSIEHSMHVAAEFTAAGIPARHIDGTSTPDERREAIRLFAAGAAWILTNCGLISEGFDVPAVEAAILLRPTQSLALYLQQVGRALRPVYAAGDLSTAEGRLAAIGASAKPRAIILDHVGNVARHGFPDDPRVWTLGGRRKKKGAAAGEEAPAVRQCPTCYSCHRPAPQCPACGHVYEIKGRVLEERAGSLQEVDRQALSFARAQEVRSAKTREDLERIAKERGYNPRWVEHQMRVRGQRQAKPGLSADAWAFHEQRYGRRAGA